MSKKLLVLALCLGLFIGLIGTARSEGKFLESGLTHDLNPSWSNEEIHRVEPELNEALGGLNKALIGLKVNQYLFFISLIISGVLTFYLTSKYLGGELNKKFSNSTSGKFFLVLLLILVAAISLRLLSPNLHLGFNEFTEITAAKNLVEKGQPLLCQYTVQLKESCQIYGNPLGVPLLISVGFFFLGISNHASFLIISTLGALSVFFLGLSTYNFSENKSAALLASLFLAICPLHIVWSSSISSFVVSLFFLILTVFFLSLHRINRNKRLSPAILLGLSFVSVLAVQIRPENILLIPGLLLGYLFLFRQEIKLREKLGEMKYWLSLLPWILIVPHLIHFVSSYNLEAILPQISVFLSSINLEVNNGLIISLLLGTSILGFISSLKSENRLGKMLLAWTAIFLAMSPLLPGQTPEKYMFLLLPGSFFLAEGLLLILKRPLEHKIVKIGFITFLALLTLASLFIVNSSYSEEIKTIDLFQKNIPQQISTMDQNYRANCFYITEQPELLTYKTNLKTISSESLIKNPELLNQSGCFLYFHGDETYLPSKHQHEIKTIKEDFEMNLLRSWDLNNVSYGLYNFKD